MYFPIKVNHLSPAQARKLMSGGSVRVRHDPRGSHIIDVNADQHKRIMRAYEKGQAHTMSFDPHQASMHGQGIMGNLLKQAVKTVKGVARANIPRAKKFVIEEIHRHGPSGVKLAERVLERAGVSPQLSHMIGAEAVGHLSRGAEQLANQGFSHLDASLAGEGIRRRRPGRPRKHKLSGGKITAKQVGRTLKNVARKVARPLLHTAVNTLVPGALDALGAMTGQPELAMLSPMVEAGANKGIDALGNKYGFGIKHKRRGRPRKSGGALFPAGYGISHHKKRGRPRK